MANGNDKCVNCGGDRELHHYQTDQCPVGGVEAPIGQAQTWKASTFLSATARPVWEVTLRQRYAGMALQGLLAAESDDHGFGPTYAKDEKGLSIVDADGNRVVTETAERKYARRAVELADELIAALSER